MGVTVLRGRNFTATDRFTDEQLNDAAVPRTGVVIVNTFVSRYFSGEDRSDEPSFCLTRSSLPPRARSSAS